MSFGLQGEMERITQRNVEAEDTGDDEDLYLSSLIDVIHMISIDSCHENEKKHTLTSATCLLLPYPASVLIILCANIATLWMLLSLFYLSDWGVVGAIM